MLSLQSVYLHRPVYLPRPVGLCYTWVNRLLLITIISILDRACTVVLSKLSHLVTQADDVSDAYADDYLMTIPSH